MVVSLISVTARGVCSSGLLRPNAVSLAPACSSRTTSSVTVTDSKSCAAAGTVQPAAASRTNRGVRWVRIENVV